MRFNLCSLPLSTHRFCEEALFVVSARFFNLFAMAITPRHLHRFRSRIHLSRRFTGFAAPDIKRHMPIYIDKLLSFSKRASVPISPTSVPPQLRPKPGTLRMHCAISEPLLYSSICDSRLMPDFIP